MHESSMLIFVGTGLRARPGLDVPVVFKPRAGLEPAPTVA